MQDAQKPATYDKKPQTSPASELDEPRWSVVSFERCEASHLTFNDARNKISELDAAKVSGLCIVTDDVAARIDQTKT